MSISVAINLRELAEGLIKAGLVVRFDEYDDIDIQGIPDEGFYMDFIEEHVGTRTPHGFIIKEGAETQLYEDLTLVLKELLYKRMKNIYNNMDQEEIDMVAKADLQSYDIEADGVNTDGDLP